jgi:hypothetical protein
MFDWLPKLTPTMIDGEGMVLHIAQTVVEAAEARGNAVRRRVT